MEKFIFSVSERQNKLKLINQLKELTYPVEII
jgi:hypothetical protein